MGELAFSLNFVKETKNECLNNTFAHKTEKKKSLKITLKETLIFQTQNNVI